MPPDAEDIPEISPCPQQLSIQLYSIVEAKHLLSNSEFELDKVAINDNVPHGRTVGGLPIHGQFSSRRPVLPSLGRVLSEQGEIPEHSPLPNELSIDLYSSTDVRQLRPPIFEHVTEIPVIPPSPQQLSVNLYCLPDVQQIHGDTTQHHDNPEISASPRQISVDLYPLDDAESFISGDTFLGVLQSTEQPEPPSGGVQQPVRSGELSNGPVALAVQEIVQACEGMRIYKHRSKLLSAKSEQIVDAFNDIARNLHGSQLQQFTDQLAGLLEGMIKITGQYSNYNMVETYLNSTKIKKELDQCESSLYDAQTLCFQVESNTKSSVTQPPRTSNKEDQRVTSEELGEQRGLLLDILRISPADLRQQIDALEGRLKSKATRRLLAAVQEELRRLREQSSFRAASGSQDSQSEILQRQLYIQFQRGLLNLYRETGIPLTHILLNGEVERTSEVPVASGTYGDIWRGTWLGKEMAVLKALKNTDSSDSIHLQRFGTNFNLWAHLKHENILSVWGVAADLDEHIYMVSPWQDNGNVLGYTRDHPNISCLELMSGASQGLSYLHSSNIIHGNMKCTNILVSSKGQACISDFGLAKLMEEVTERSASLTLTEGGCARWMAPELIEGKALSQEADVYSFAMTILELMTGKHPYAECEQDAQVLHSIAVLKKTPARPQGDELLGHDTTLSDELWDMMFQCWCKDALKRPSMTEVCSILKEINRLPVSVTG